MDYLAFKRVYHDDLLHFGIKRRSGRYPYGSGNRPYQGESSIGKKIKQVTRHITKSPLQNVMDIDREMEDSGAYKRRQERRAEIKDFLETLSPDVKKVGKITLTTTMATGLSVAGSAAIGSILGLSGIGEAALAASSFITLNKLGYDYLLKSGVITKEGDGNWEVRMKRINS